MTSTITINDVTGEFTGSIEIPAELEKGVKLIELLDDEGNVLAVGKYADGTFIDGATRRGLKSTVSDLYGPICQTFALENATDVAGIDIYLNTKGGGSGDIVLQVREVEGGIPTKVILAETRIAYASLTTGWLSFLFKPIHCLAGKEYAIVLYSDNTSHRVAVAELGEVDEDTNEAVTKQSYRQGVFQQSSNNTAWTISQTADITFRVLKAVYSGSTRTVNLGTVAVTAITDFMVLAHYDLPSRDCSVKFLVTDVANSIIYTVDKNQPTRLGYTVTGNFTVQAVLTGTAELSPILYPDTQLMVGAINTSALYITRNIEVTDSGPDITVKLECKLEAGSSLAVKVESGSSGTYSSATIVSALTKVLPDGWERRVYKKTGITPINTGSILKTKIKLELGATATGRPFVRGLAGIESAT